MYLIISTILLHSFLQDINITISEIQPDYCQKLNTNFQDNPCAIDCDCNHEISDDILEMAATQSQKCFTKFVRENCGWLQLHL